MSRSGASRRVPPAAGIAVPSDRRFHRADLGADRRRLGRSLLRGIKWVSGLAVLGALGAWVADAVLEARLLDVQQVVVRGNGRLSVADVQGLVDGVRGQNILRVDLEVYRRRVLDSPWVADVVLTRVLPSTVEVVVTERSPMAIARVGQQLFLVDEAGVIVDEYGVEYGDLDLPIVDGLVSSPGGDGPLVDRDRVRLTAAFLTALGARRDLRARLSQVDVSNVHDVVVMFDHAAVWLHLGEERFVERLNTYLELAPMLEERFGSLDYVDLRFGERVFVRPRDGAARLVAER
jgi:cell division protein FtsQ